MNRTQQVAKDARKTLRENTYGILSTISVDVPGYPFGSVTPYALTDDCEPFILIASIAQHTKNINANSKVALTVQERGGQDPQTSGRLTLIGDAYPVREDDGHKPKYVRYFPNSKDYFKTHDFHFYQISLVKVRFIGGFGEIYWVEKNDFLQKNPLAEAEAHILSHMNEDHANALRNYCKAFGATDPAEVHMIGIDSEGFDVLADGKFHRFEFDRPIGNSQEARERLVEMAKKAQEIVSQL